MGVLYKLNLKMGLFVWKVNVTQCVECYYISTI